MLSVQLPAFRVLKKLSQEEKTAKTTQLQFEAILQELIGTFHLLQIELMAGYAAMFVLSSILLLYLRRNRNEALRGDYSAARKAIIPAFIPLLWLVILISFGYTLFFIIALSIKSYVLIDNLDAQIFNAGGCFVSVLVLVFMFQKSVSIPALRRASILTAFISTYGILTMYYLIEYGASLTQQRYFIAVEQCGLIIFYVYVYIWPPLRASKRAIREYCMFSTISMVMSLVHVYYFHHKTYDTGMKLVLANAIWISFYPMFIWRVLRADTEYWRGLGQRAVGLQQLLRQRKHVDEIISSEGLHLLIEMHRKYVIDFAYLEIMNSIGKGSTSSVFKGLLHSRTPVAIKVYTPHELNEEAVSEYSNEAALCGSLQHPNIVEFYGMCVCPPNICLISELCHSSLADVLDNTASRLDAPASRLQLHINLLYMIDAARAIAYLHSFSPPFIHRDIKPENYLIDDRGFVKLTDFGESRSLAGQNNSNDVNIVIEETVENKPSTSYQAMKSPSVSRHGKLSCMSVRGTVDYMAPEMMRGRGGKANYTESVDIYSLAITLWRILHPIGEIYNSNGNHLKVYELVLSGKRPEFNKNTPEKLQRLIESAWSSDIAMRPSARNIVNILEEIQEETYALFAKKMSDEIKLHENRVWKGKAYSNVIEGTQIVEYLVDHEYVDNSNEAIRLGNALMDSSLIHHVKHNCSFEDSETLYFFSEQRIHDCLPIHQRDTNPSVSSYPDGGINKEAAFFQNAGDHVSVSSLPGFSVASSSGFFSIDPLCSCSCRKMAQGYIRRTNKKNKPQRFYKNKNNNVLVAQITHQNSLLAPRLLTKMDRNEFEAFDSNI